MNKYAPHLYVIPEDDRDRQIASGFVGHHQVITPRIQVMPPAGGWSHVLRTFQEEYIPALQKYPQAHVVMLIDFDGRIEDRRSLFERAIPDDIKDRVFVIGAKDTPEALRTSLGFGFERIGERLADDCDGGEVIHWNHEQLQHNDAERERLAGTVRQFLFATGSESSTRFT